MADRIRIKKITQLEADYSHEEAEYTLSHISKNMAGVTLYKFLQNPNSWKEGKKTQDKIEQYGLNILHQEPKSNYFNMKRDF